jgi:hypothetical protein
MKIVCAATAGARMWSSSSGVAVRVLIENHQ